MVPNKEEHSFPAIYLFTNKKNGKIYVGSAKDVAYRFTKYRDGYEKNRPIAWAITKYGFDQFEFSIIERVDCPANLLKREQHYLDTLLPFDERGYNLCHTAGSTLGVKYSKESRQRLSQARKGKASKAILQIDPISLDVIAEYKAIQDAAKAIGLGVTVVSNAARGIKLTAGGFLWCFKKAYDPLTFNPRKRIQRGGPRGKTAKPVIQFDVDGKQLRIWDHVSVAANALSVHPDCIRGACYGRIKIAHGYRWSFVTDETIIFEVNERRRKEWNIKNGTAIR